MTVCFNVVFIKMFFLQWAVEPFKLSHRDYKMKLTIFSIYDPTQLGVDCLDRFERLDGGKSNFSSLAFIKWFC